MTLKGISLQTKVVSSVFFFALSACGASDNGDQAVVDIGTNPDALLLIPSVEAGAPMSSAEVQIWDDAITPIASTVFTNEPVTPWSDVPSSGSADIFVGGVELVPNGNDNDRVFGTMNATTNFGNGSITGEAQNFFSGAGNAQPGTLIFDAAFFRGNDLATEFGISGTLTGNLTGDIINGFVDVDIAGDFADSATVIYGGGSGTLDGGTSVDAAFVLSQN